MKFSFYSAALGDIPLPAVLEWTAQNGFDSVEIDFKKHIENAEMVGTVMRRAREAGVSVSAITFFGNLLEPDRDLRKELRTHVRKLYDRACEEGVPALVLFPGRNETISEEENYVDIAEFLNSLSSDFSSTKIAIENWPGPHRNFVATTPAGWKRLFASVSSKVGLEFDPSHLLWQGIDPLQALRDFKDRLVLLHAKDTKIFPERIQEVGYAGPFWEYCLPGRGALDWKLFLRVLQEDPSFDGSISIEHEDAAFGWPHGSALQRQEGLRLGLETLRRNLSENPSAIHAS